MIEFKRRRTQGHLAFWGVLAVTQPGCALDIEPPMDTSPMKLTKAAASESRSMMPIGIAPSRQYSESAENNRTPGIIGIYDATAGRLDVQYLPLAGTWAGVGVRYVTPVFPKRFVFGTDGDGERFVHVQFMGQILATSLIDEPGDYVLEDLDTQRVDELVFVVNMDTHDTTPDGRLPIGSFGLFLPMQ